MKVVDSGIGKNFSQFRDSTQEKAKTGLRVAGEIIKTASIGNTPLDTGFLRRSEYVIDASIATKEIPVVEIGAFAHYAIDQHENLQYRHKVGRAKFLQSAISENVEIIIRGLMGGMKL